MQNAKCKMKNEKGESKKMIDIDAVRNKLKSIQTKTTKKTGLWRPEPGKSTVRIVPYKFNKDNPFIELYFHYRLNNKNLLSPITNGNPDPVQEFAEKLKNTGSKDDWKMGRKLEPKMRTYVPVVVRGEESEGIKFWGFGIQIYEELLSIIADPEYGDITDPITGTDITIEKKTPEEAGNAYGSTVVRPKRRQSKLTEDSTELENYLTEQKDIMEIYNEPTYEELEVELKKWLDPDNKSGDKSEKEAVDKYINSGSTTTTEKDDLESVLNKFDEKLKG